MGLCTRAVGSGKMPKIYQEATQFAWPARMTTLIRHFEVNRNNLRDTRLNESPLPAVTAEDTNRVVLRIEHFALTANNITYAAFGDAMQYWNFFPAEAGWGRVPVWGFATVAASGRPEVAVGERVYGYFPMSSHLVVRADRVTATGFIDSSPHRVGLPLVYNQYTRCAVDPGYDPAREAEQMLLKPLFTTSFLIDDFLADNEFFGARRVILSSASSKTAYGTAFLMAHRRAGAAANRPIDAVVGLTSTQNFDFVQSLGVYDEVVPYNQISRLSRESSVYVDMAGNQSLREAIHGRLGEQLKYSCAVGGTHWENIGGGTSSTGAALPGPKPALFFAPNQIKKRLADWGAPMFASRTAKAWNDFMQRVSNPTGPWLTVRRSLGETAMRNQYLETLDGKTRADQGIVLGFEQHQ